MLFGTGSSSVLAAAGSLSPVNTTTQPLTNTSTINPALITPILGAAPDINCYGKISSEGAGTSGSYNYDVLWTIASINNPTHTYKIHYEGDDSINPQTLTSLWHTLLPNPYVLPKTAYQLKAGEASKTAFLSVQLLDLFNNDKVLKGYTCKLNLTNKNSASTTDNTNNLIQITPNILDRDFLAPPSTSLVFSNLTVSPDPYVPSDSSSASFNYDLDTGGKDLYVNFTVMNGAKTKTVFSKSSKINYKGSTFTLWNGKDQNGQAVPAGSYYLKATLTDAATSGTINSSQNLTTFKTLEKTFSVQAGTAAGTGQTGGSQAGSGSSSSAGAASGSAGSSGSTTGAAGTTGTSEEASKPPLKPSPIELKCTPESKVLYFENDEPAYDRIFVNCSINLPATVKASIYKKAYDPANADNSANLVKEILLETPKKKGLFKVGWDGFDDYDRPVALEEYNFVVEALIDSTYKPKISAKQFKVENVPAPESAQTEDGAAAEGDNGQASAENVENLHGAADETPKPGLLEQVSTAIFGEETSLTDQQASAENKPAEKIMSKCPNVFYPIDIANSPYESLIKKAFDECLVGGYPDGTFRHKEWITRPEAIKMTVLASGNIAKQGCFDADCGSPFMDLDMWMGPWVRAAWDLKFINGVGPNRLGTGYITRAEAVALMDKAFKIPPFQGCYTANCGAGHPNSFFTDITQSWQGPYLRAAWDKGIIQPLTPGKFYPENPMSRAMFLELLFQAKSLK